MITRSSIAFEDFLGSSIAPQVMPPWAMQAYLLPCWWVVWWLWRAGCISQDTYLLYCVIVIVNKEYQPGYVRHKHVKVHRWLWCWQEQTHFLTLSESFIAQHVFLLYTFSIKVVPAKSYIMNNQISHLFSTCGSFVLTLGDVDSGDNVGSADFTICSNIIEI